MSDDTQQPIIVKKINKIEGGHHGGAWKIAYADFVTAMMAFFLLMWLLGSTAQGDKEGIAEFFQNPLKVAMKGGDGSGDSSSIIPGGGEDLSRKAGQIRRGASKPKRNELALDAARYQQEEEKSKATEQAEKMQLIDLKEYIESVIDADSLLKSFKNQILMDITSEGLRIQIVDEQNRPMFTSASSELQAYTKVLLHAIGKALNDVRNRLSLSGHTDAKPFSGEQRGFSNWELSTRRANASRRELIVGGLGKDKVMRIVGLADTIPFNPDDPYDPANRRISIIVLNKRTEIALQGKDRATISVDNTESLKVLKENN